MTLRCCIRMNLRREPSLRTARNEGVCLGVRHDVPKVGDGCCQPAADDAAADCPETRPAEPTPEPCPGAVTVGWPRRPGCADRSPRSRAPTPSGLGRRTRRGRTIDRAGLAPTLVGADPAAVLDGVGFRAPRLVRRALGVGGAQGIHRNAAVPRRPGGAVRDVVRAAAGLVTAD